LEGDVCVEGCFGCLVCCLFVVVGGLLCTTSFWGLFFGLVLCLLAAHKTRRIGEIDPSSIFCTLKGEQKGLI
jgi:hypothetical protein